MNKKNKYLSLTVLFIFLFFFVFILSSSIQDKPDYLSYDSSSALKSNFDNIKKGLTYEQAIIDGNILNCDYIKEPHLVDSCKLSLVNCSSDDCYFDKARYENNEQLCFNIDDDKKRAGCSSSITFSNIKQQAVLDDDISICEKFESLDMINHCKDNYFIAKRFNDNDKSYCNNILNEVMKNECLK